MPNLSIEMFIKEKPEQKMSLLNPFVYNVVKWPNIL